MIMKALITEKFHPILQSTFGEYGIDCIIYENIDTAGVQEIIEAFDILIVNSKILVDKQMLDKTKNLKAIGRVGSGMEIVDTEYCRQKGIFVCSAPEGNANAVAEHAMAMLLAGFNNLFHAQMDLLNGKWLREIHRGQELKGKTIAIIGFGHTGQAFAQKLKGFEVSVLAHDILPLNVSESYIKEATLEEIFEKAEIVSLHLPLNEETFHYVNADFLQKCKHKISILNTSRGKIIDFRALIGAIENEKVHKVFLDVFENEPFEEIENVKKYIQEKKLHLTPHIAGWSSESYFLLSKLVSEKIVNQLFNKRS